MRPALLSVGGLRDDKPFAKVLNLLAFVILAVEELDKHRLRCESHVRSIGLSPLEKELAATLAVGSTDRRHDLVT